ncbi:MAG: biotin/lipoyl-binding protein [Gemmataceae bacterium]|nr:biotin/lipoyl-binding protein [Gemmataceae bacterium]
MRNLLIALLFPAYLIAAPKEVHVVQPVGCEITDHAAFIGKTDTSQTVEIRTRVSGYLKKVLFKEGSDVQKGEILFQLDDRNQKAGFDRVRGGTSSSGSETEASRGRASTSDSSGATQGDRQGRDRQTCRGTGRCQSRDRGHAGETRTGQAEH